VLLRVGFVVVTGLIGVLIVWVWVVEGVDSRALRLGAIVKICLVVAYLEVDVRKVEFEVRGHAAMRLFRSDKGWMFRAEDLVLPPKVSKEWLVVGETITFSDFLL